MLQRLARWLRAAGYDTLIAREGESDREIVARARREGRLVLSRDRKLMELGDAPGTVILLRENTLQGSVDELSRQLRLNWLYRPFSRCLVCNTLLVDADSEARRRQPPGARDLAGPLRLCPYCDKLYWTGGHVRRMRLRLDGWAARGTRSSVASSATIRANRARRERQ